MLPRKAHVKRIFLTSTDSDGNIQTSEDIFIDVMRIDRVSIYAAFPTLDGLKGQTVVHVLEWNDDINNPDEGVDASNADSQFENANANRTTEQIPIPNPAGDGGVSGLYLWAIKKVKIQQPRGASLGPIGQTVNFAFNNKPADGSLGTPSKRRTTVIRVPNNTLNGLQMTNDDGSSVIMDWDTYRQALLDGLPLDENGNPTVIDDKVALLVDVTRDFSIDFGIGGAPVDAGIAHQTIKYFLGNDDILNLFAAGDPKAVDPDGKTLVVRTDPLQVIVNVSSDIIAVTFPAGTSP